MDHRVAVNSVQPPYADDGAGEPVIFVHGSNADHRVWDAHRNMMVPHCRMIRVTMRYFGADAWPDRGEKFSLEVLADDLAAFIQNLALQPVTLIGWSLGAAVCLTLATQNPSLVKRMFLYEPALATFVSDAEKRQEALEDRIAMSERARVSSEAGDLDASVQQFVEDVNAQDGAFAQLSEIIQRMMLENARMLPLLFAGPPAPPVDGQALRSLRLPVTIGLGAQSRTFYQISARAAHAHMSFSELIIIHGARHLLPVQKPEQFCEAVLEFLQREVPVELI